MKIPSKQSADRRDASWDLQNIIKNYSSLVAAQIGSAALAFGSVYLATRFFGTEGYGGIVAVLAASQTAQILINWTCVALARYGVQEFVETGAISKSFWGRGLIFFVSVVVLLVCAPLWLPFFVAWLKLPPEVAPLILIHLVVTAFWLHVQNALQAAKLIPLQGVLLMIERAFIFSILLTLGLTQTLSWQIAFVAYIVAPAIMIVVGLWKTRLMISLKPIFDGATIKKILAFSLPLVPYSVINYLSTSYLDAFFITQYLPKSELGAYAVAYQVNGIILQFPTLLNTLLMPMFVTLISSGRELQIKKYLEEILPLATLLWGIFAVALAAGACVFLPFFFREDYAQIQRVLWVLAAGATLAFPALVGFSPYAVAREAVYISTPYAVAVALGNLAGNIFLIPLYGIVGSAWATVASFACGLILLLALMYHRFSLAPRWTLDATLPAIGGAAIYTWTESIWQTLPAIGLSLLLIVLIRHRSITKAVKSAIVFRKEMRGA